MKQGIQKFGRFLSGMVMPNIGAFIAWGLITAMFIPTGWAPNDKLAAIVGPMLTYLLPLLIGYTGGKIVYDTRGGVVGAIATTGVIIGANVPMFLGAMIMGPLAAFVMKQLDRLWEKRVPHGFEMLVNNFSAGIFGGIMSILGFLAIGPSAEAINNALGAGVGWLVNHGLLPLTSVLVEPAKVLFLNNAINHGVFTPLGAQEAAEVGRSIFFMIESNPGPGLGLLLAYMLFGKGTSKASASGAAIIHFFGGIHEIYFPYVLMNPVLILAMIGGGASGVFTINLLHGGLIGAASPGSIIAEMTMTPKGAHLANIVGITVACGVTFILSAILMKLFVKAESEGDLEASQELMRTMKAQSKGQSAGQSQDAGAGLNLDKAQDSDQVALSNVHKIVFACDAGMGSSAMGASKLRKKLKNAGLGDIEVIHSSVDDIPGDADVIICHNNLSGRAKSANPRANLVGITDFLNAPEYDGLIDKLKDSTSKS
ncbi:MAG: PTS mannitol transporter subunit IICB [Deltaproteobacteria bacterium]|jgi:PTS system mannitol-specific IIC component|nr:PTS mannitol transporter subunit IICB [Deltaproteobacteria bacterium]